MGVHKNLLCTLRSWSIKKVLVVWYQVVSLEIRTVIMTVTPVTTSGLPSYWYCTLRWSSYQWPWNNIEEIEKRSTGHEVTSTTTRVPMCAPHVMEPAGYC